MTLTVTIRSSKSCEIEVTTQIILVQWRYCHKVSDSLPSDNYTFLCAHRQGPALFIPSVPLHWITNDLCNALSSILMFVCNTSVRSLIIGTTIAIFTCKWFVWCSIDNWVIVVCYVDYVVARSLFFIDNIIDNITNIVDIGIEYYIQGLNCT